MRVDCLVEAIEAARESWDYVTGLVPKIKATWKPAPDGWSLKDILAHVAWHELEMIGLIRTRVLSGSPWWELSTDERNQKIYELYRDRSLVEIVETAEDAYHRLLTALRALPDEALNDPQHFDQMPSDWVPWRVIASNTYGHYLRHVGQVRKLAEQLRQT